VSLQFEVAEDVGNGRYPRVILIQVFVCNAKISRERQFCCHNLNVDEVVVVLRTAEGPKFGLTVDHISAQQSGIFPGREMRHMPRMGGVG